MTYYKNVILFLKEWGISESSALAYGSTLLISLAPFLLLFLIRVENTPQHRNYLRVALSFASGGLLGDAFLHLIPHSMGHSSHEHAAHHNHGHEHSSNFNSHGHPHDHSHGDHHHPEEHHGHQHSHAEHIGEKENHHHSHIEQTYVGLYILAGIILFFLIEKLIHYLKGSEGHSHSHGGNKHGKSKVSSSEEEEEEENESSEKPLKKNIKFNKKIRSSNKVSSKTTQTRFVSGLLNLIADFLHNFTDGLAIGATFASTGSTVGTITSISILMHEIPHEIGDYAILIQAGYKRHNAIALQLVTAIGALAGTAVGLRYGTLEHATQFILPITAGGFIYIATVSVIPELLEKTTSRRQSLLEIGAMLSGILMMFYIALNE